MMCLLAIFRSRSSVTISTLTAQVSTISSRPQALKNQPQYSWNCHGITQVLLRIPERLLELRARCRSVDVGRGGGVVQPQSEHHHRLLTLVVRVLGLDEVHVGLVEAQLERAPLPVGAEEVPDVRDSEVGAVDGVVLPVAGLPQKLLLLLSLDQLDHSLRLLYLGGDLVGERHVQLADGVLRRHVGPERLLHEEDPAHGLGVRVLHPHRERQPVLPERVEAEAELLAGLGHRREVACHLDVAALGLEDLDVSGLGHLGEVLLILEGLVLLVVRHAEDAEARFVHLMAFGEDHEPAHGHHGITGGPGTWKGIFTHLAMKGT